MLALVRPINTNRLFIDFTATFPVVPTYLSAGPENKSVLQIEAVVADISDGSGLLDIHGPANNILFCDRGCAAGSSKAYSSASNCSGQSKQC